jgi:hypothetical protein
MKFTSKSFESEWSNIVTFEIEAEEPAPEVIAEPVVVAEEPVPTPEVVVEEVAEPVIIAEEPVLVPEVIEEPAPEVVAKKKVISTVKDKPILENDVTKYFGEVSLLNYSDVKVDFGTLLFPGDNTWLKVSHDGNLFYLAKKPIRYNVSWNDQNTITGQSVLDGTYDFITTEEWLSLIDLVKFTNEELHVYWGRNKNGYITWTKEIQGIGALGQRTVANYKPSARFEKFGFRPVIRVA